MEFESKGNLSGLQCADWRNQKRRGSRKRRKHNPKDEETANTTETDYVKNSEDNNIDSSTTESLKDSVPRISRDEADTDAAIPAGKCTEESEKSSSTEEVVFGSNPRKMLDFDLNELPPMEDGEE